MIGRSREYCHLPATACRAVFALITLGTTYSEFVLSWIPFYGLFKCLLLLYIQLPQTAVRHPADSHLVTKAVPPPLNPHPCPPRLTDVRGVVKKVL